MSGIDWLVLAGYLVAVVAIGIGFRHQRGEREFLIASGGLVWWAVGLSLIATSVSSTSFLGTPAEAFEHDLRLLMLNLPVPISLVIVWSVFIPWLRRQNALSAYEILGTVFGVRTQLLASAVYMAHLLLRLGVLVFGPAIVLAEMTGLSIESCIVLVGVVAVFYSTLGGLRAVVWTDVLQFGALALGIVLIYLRLADLVPEGLARLWSAAAEAGKTRWFDGSLNPADARSLASAVFAYLFFDLAIRTGDQQFVQRYLSCRSVKEAQLSALISVLLGFAVSVSLFALGALLWGFAKTHQPELLKVHGNFVIARFALDHLAFGGAGVVAAGVFAAAMSSIDSALSALTATASQDVLKRVFHQRISVGKLRLITVSFGIVGIGIALWVSQTGASLLEIALSLAAVFPGVLLALFGLARFKVRLTDKAVAAGAMCGILAVAIAKVLFASDLSWPWWPALSALTTTLTAPIFNKVLKR